MASARGRFIAALSGTIAVAICCFTPILVIALAGIGLAAFTPYLDYVLWPGLVVLLVITWRAYREYAGK